ncbi:MAG: Hsp20/alpha crystallin family protein [Candidatus Bathyarchaeia archaeon]|jgi:HSP20 family molecular chaperone IbpA
MANKELTSESMSRNMDQLMSLVDEKSKRIIEYFLSWRQAGIRKLSDLICASSDMEVLIKIREIINPKALEILGVPFVTFERSKIDLLTGKKITFSWWLNEELIERIPFEQLLDVLDEKKTLRVVAALPSGDKDVEIQVKGESLIISGKEYHQEVQLFCSVEKEVTKTVNNGVLEIKLRKTR